MNVGDELALLIKSKYPVVFVESIDENHSLRQLRATAEHLDLLFYHWSLTQGLVKGENSGSYYQTREPIGMLKMLMELAKPRAPGDGKPGIFVFKDFEKCLDDGLTLRLFKDAINLVRNTKNTFVILSSNYQLPKEVEADSARLVGGYPAEKEIADVVNETTDEFSRTHAGASARLSEDEFGRVAGALRGLSIQQIRNVVNQCLLDRGTLDGESLNAIERYKKKLFDQDGWLEFYLTEDKTQAAGFHNLKRWVTDRKSSFSPGADPSLPAPKGLLLMGVQGCGKSLACKVIAREFGLPLYRLDLGRMYSKFVGETETNLRKVLMIVEKLSPLCLWIDEIEKAFGASQGEIDGGVSQRLLGTFLTWMQERKSTCFLSATANDVYRLPPEFLRKGRFDEIFFVGLPDNDARRELFAIHLRRRSLDPGGVDLAALADRTEGFSGAEIEQAVISALYRAGGDKAGLTTDLLVKEVASTKSLSVLKREEMTALREWAKERTIPA